MEYSETAPQLLLSLLVLLSSVQVAEKIKQTVYVNHAQFSYRFTNID